MFHPRGREAKTHTLSQKQPSAFPPQFPTQLSNGICGDGDGGGGDGGGGDGGGGGNVTSSHCSFAPLSHSHAFASLPARAATATYQLGSIWAAIVQRGAEIVAETGAGGGSSTKAKASLAVKALFSPAHRPHAELRRRIYIYASISTPTQTTAEKGGRGKRKGAPLPLRRSHRSSRPAQRTCLPQLADHRSITFYTCLSLAIQ